jgi:secretion/DNA translocation related TadE-like protein
VNRLWASLRAERGSGSILAVAVMASVLAVAGMMVPVTAALVVKQRVAGAADAAALAAADTASGLLAGFPCEAAGRAARANDAEIGSCVIEGMMATVTARANYLGLAITVSARAGPPGDL